MCRANRITKNKSKCNIYLWCSKNKIMNVLNYLSENAEELIDKIFKYKVSDVCIKKIENIPIKNNNKIIYENIINKLKCETKISHVFIDDFFSFYNQNSIDEDIIINLEIVVKWLEVKKGNLTRLLVANFEKEFDYSIERKYIKRKSTGLCLQRQVQ